MLDQETKRKIDNCRDILVGKVPDPKSQVEQITIALIYKFMDDMDKESVEMGGLATFFKEGYAKYAWSKIFDPRLGGNDLMILYSEAILKMNQNPNIPQLFRDIFKNAYLPYRDPETLKSFLKEINEFKYDHSERLGDAYEYLLSVMDKQGDAGQFRTPRHIIDFIVQIVDPKKNETVLDPACGTAGFLISSYKLILKNNTKDRPGDMLTPDEKKRILNNFIGYDISPDMVRLSLVNMYLHGFPNPRIIEYDTLTSEEHWNDKYDVILANPPFMSPKGGIRPHKRFSIEAKRSEVLFVDYIAEHLNPNGRAGVIVPEGIIFQSGTAYKNLRKMLVENYVWAVVSLPAGVFNPYSGVKTSVLLMDKSFPKRIDQILFLKIENDGFDLGAQRRKVDNNDLPGIVSYIGKYRQAILNNLEIPFTTSSLIVSKNNIHESGDYTLSGERYRQYTTKISRFDEVEIGSICEILDHLRVPITKSSRVHGKYPYYGATGVLDYVENFIFNERLVLIGEDGAKWSTGEKTAFIVEGKYWVNNHAHILRPDTTKIFDTYLVEIINLMDLNRYVTGVTVPKLTQEKLRSIKIPLPPLDIQKAIVEEIEGYQKIIDGGRMVVENYKPKIKIDPKWEVIELGTLANMEYGYNEAAKEEGDARYIRITDIDQDGYLKDNEIKYVRLTPESEPYLLKKGDIVVARTGATYGKTLYFTESIQAVFAGYLIRINLDNTKILNKYYWIFTQSDYYETQKKSLMQGGGQPQFNAKAIQRIMIPLPPLNDQHQIIAQIENEQNIVNSNKKLIEIYEQKIKDKIAEVWGE